MKFTRMHPSLLAIAIFIPLALAYWPFKVDDAYISFVYAKNLVENHGLTYNGIVVEGYSNFLWTILMAPFIRLGIDPLVAARIVSLLSACIILFITEKLLRRLNPDISNAECLLVLSTIALSTPFTAWTLGGLETIFMCLWVILFVYWEIGADQKSLCLAVLASLACALTRPEGAMLFPILLLHRMIYRKQSLRQLLTQSAIFILPFSAYLLWRYTTYGYWVPNTAFLKLEPGAQIIFDAAKWILIYWQLRPLFAILVGLGLAEITRKKLFTHSEWVLVGAVIVAFVCFILYAGPDWMPFHRFLVPVIPLFSLLVGRAFALFQQKFLKRMVLIIAVTTTILEIAFAILIYIPYTPQFGDYTDGLIRCGEWIRQNTLPQDTIAVVDAGALAYYSERRTIDIIGLNDVHIAHSPLKSDIDYVLKQNPKIIQLHVDFTESGMIITSRQDHNRAMVNQADFLNLYAPYSGEIEDPFFPILFIRKTDQ